MTYRRTVHRTRWIAGLLVVGLTVIGAGSGWVLEALRGPQFQATTDVLVQFWGVQGFLLTGQSSPVSTQDVADAATLATSPDVLQLAATRLDDGRSSKDLATIVTATPDLISHGITITATGRTADSAEQTSRTVADAMTTTLDRQIAGTATGLSGLADGDFPTLLQQRAQVLTTSVQPLHVLETAPAQQTAPTLKTPIMLGVVGLAAGVLLMIALVFAYPVISRSRDAQRLLDLPAVPFAQPHGGPDAARLVRRLLDTRPEGQILVVPVDAGTEKTAQQFAEWARARTSSAAESPRIATVPEPVGAVLDPRPENTAAVVLVVPEGTARRTVTDAVALLATWRAADAVVVPA